MKWHARSAGPLGHPLIEMFISLIAILALSIIFTWFYNNTISLPIVMLFHAAINSFDDVYETIFSTLTQKDWELPYLLGILTIGILLSFVFRYASTAQANRQ